MIRNTDQVVCHPRNSAQRDSHNSDDDLQNKSDVPIWRLITAGCKHQKLQRALRPLDARSLKSEFDGLCESVIKGTFIFCLKTSHIYLCRVSQTLRCKNHWSQNFKVCTGLSSWRLRHRAQQDQSSLHDPTGSEWTTHGQSDSVACIATSVAWL